MNMKLLTIFIFSAILNYIKCEKYNNNGVDVILNLLNEHYSTTFIITFYSCTSKRESYEIIKKLSINGFTTLLVNEFNGYFQNHKEEEHMLNVIDLSCNYSSYLLEKADEYKFFASPFRWLIINTRIIDHSLNNYENAFRNLAILADSDVTIICLLHENVYNIIKIFKRRRSLEIIVENVAKTMNNKLIFDSSFNANSIQRRRNLGGIVINNCNVITHNESFHHLLDKRDKHLDTITKVNYIFMLHLGDLLNVSMNFSFVSTWGYFGNDSKWTGMIGELTRNHADIGGTPLFFTSDRVRIIDYIAMTTPTKSKFVFKQPKLSYIANVYTLPFEMDVWLASYGLVVVIALVLFIVVKWEWYKKRTNHTEINNDSNASELPDSIIEVTFMAFTAVCQQGASAIPFNISGRIITILLYTSLMFLYTSYSANIVALLQSSSTSIQTLEDLLKSRLDVGVDDTVFNHFYFPNATEPVRRALYLQKVIPPGQPPRFFPIAEGVRRLRQGLFAFHMETGAGYKIVGETFLEDEKCDLQEIPFLQVPDPFLAVQKNTSFKEFIKIGLRKMHESGIQNREVSLLYTKKPVCGSRGSSFVGVAIVDCYPAAMLFAIGIAIAFSVFVLEICADQFAKQRKWRVRRLFVMKSI